MCNDPDSYVPLSGPYAGIKSTEACCQCTVVPPHNLSLSLFVQFKVTMHSSSGLKVNSLRVENEEHQPYKGVRSVTRAGTFEVRC